MPPQLPRYAIKEELRRAFVLDRAVIREHAFTEERLIESLLDVLTITEDDAMSFLSVSREGCVVCLRCILRLRAVVVTHAFQRDETG